MDRLVRRWCSVKAKEVNGILGSIRKGIENKAVTQHYAIVQLLSPPCTFCAAHTFRSQKSCGRAEKKMREKQEGWNDFQKRRGNSLWFFSLEQKWLMEGMLVSSNCDWNRKVNMGHLFVISPNTRPRRCQSKLSGSSCKANKRKHFSPHDP